MDNETTATTPEADDAFNRGAPATDLIGKKCFVIMPFRTKLDTDGREINFDDVYSRIIRKAFQNLGLDCERSDTEPSSGLIPAKMIEDILTADVVVADITTGNANVFYELGIRHTAKPSGTVIVRRQGGKPPFDVSSMVYLEYVLDESDPMLERRISDISKAIATALRQRRTDSLVHSLIPGLNLVVRSQPRHDRKIKAAKLPGPSQDRAKLIGVITGDLIYVEDVDVWVNPESTHMTMARTHDDSVSATIRYHGAKLGSRGEIVRDSIGDELSRAIRGRRHPGGQTNVEATTVVVTGVGELRKENRVRKIFHVAAQHGEPCKGYVTVRSFEDCVKRVLEKVDEVNRNDWRVWVGLERPLQSVIFPLFGTKGSQIDPKDVATKLVRAARTYLETWPQSSVNKVYFLAYTDADLELCEAAFQRLQLKLEEKSKA